MAKNNNLTDFLTGIADAIRTKKGTTALINPQDFESEIASIESGGGGTNKLPQVVDGTLLNITAEDLQGATSIRSYAFYYSDITSIVIPDSVTSVGSNAFQSCSSLTRIVISNSVTSIGSNAFKYCSALKSIVIPDSVTSIGNSAFYNCSSLTSIVISNSVTSIGSNALKIGSTTRKATITMLSTTPPSIQSNTFDKTLLNKIIVPKGTGNTYRAATNWSAFADYITENKSGSGGAGA